MKVAWPYQVNQGSMELRIGVADFEKNRYDDFHIDTSGRYNAFLWSSDGSRAYVFDQIYGILALDMHNGTLLDDMDDLDGIVDVFDLGSDVMALTTVGGMIALYDLSTAECLMEIDSVMGMIKGITYNPATGLVVVATNYGVDIFDLNAGARVFGTILHPKDYAPSDGLKVYSSNDGSWLIYVKSYTPILDDYDDDYELSRYYETSIVPLYSSAQLYDLAAEFE